MTRYAVVALFDPLDIDATISRREWPPHVTLASNFATVASADHVVTLIGANILVEPLNVRVGAEELFGPNHDVPVRLVDAPRAEVVHERLASHLPALAGFAPEEPAYWRAGYRPHLTLGPSVAAREGDLLIARHIAVVEIRESDAHVVAIFSA